MRFLHVLIGVLLAGTAAGDPAVRSNGVAATQPAAAGSAQSQPAEAEAKIRCDEPVYTFVKPWSGDKLEHTFVIHNDGKGPLVITKIQPSCSCTVPGVVAPLHVAPGGEVKIPASLGTATTQEGEMLKQITLECNDPVISRLVLGLKVNLTPRIAMVPSGAVWGRLGPQSPAIIIVRLTNNTTEKMKLEAIAEPDQTVFAGTLKETAPGKAAEVVVELKKTMMREGGNEANLRFNTGLTGQPELKVYCNAYLPPTLEITPESIYANLTSGLDFRRLVVIQYNGEGTLDVKSATSNAEQIKVELTPREPGRAYHLLVAIPATFHPPNDKSLEIKLLTGSKQYPTITIPVTVKAAVSTQPAAGAATRPGGVVEKR